MVANSPTNELRKGGEVVGTTDQIYPIEGAEVTFGEILVQGDLSGDLRYNGAVLRVKHINATIGLLIDQRGARGPVWQGVTCVVED